MKKTISVNIAGLLFHVEEDAYERLRVYLDAVRRYFSRYEGQSEIVTDIESRVAEIFSGKLSEHRQVITADDVDELIRTMGDVKDFEAAGEDSTETAGTNEPEAANTPKTEKKPRPIRRDNRRKVIGGVCAGLGHHLGMDPVWIRVGLTLLVFASYGSLILGYIIAWIAIPGSDDLEDQPTVKKLYRDQQNAVLGGVASGLEHYTGVERSALRIAFVILAFIGGFGVLLYIILWIAVPEAVSLTDKMTMKGESVTLDNIDRSVRDSGKEAEQSETTFARIVLFPFRLLRRMLNAAGPLIRGFAKVIRIIIGIFLIFFGGVTALAWLLATSIALDLVSGSSAGLGWLYSESEWIVTDQHLAIEALRLAFPPLLIVFTSVAAFIPLLLILLLGISLTAGRMIINRYTGWTMAGLFIVCLAGLSFMLPGAIAGFAEVGTWKVDQALYIKKGTPVFRGQEGETPALQSTELELEASADTTLRLVRYFYSNGKTRKEAVANAKLITHQVNQSDSLFTIDTNIGLAEGTPFRAQRLRMKLLIPYGRTIQIDRSLLDLSDRHYASEAEEEGLETFTADSTGVRCITCRGRISGAGSSGEASNELDLRDFTAIRAAGAFDLRVFQADNFAVFRKDGGSMEELTEDFQMYIEDETLVIRRRARIGFTFGDQSTPTIIVHLPKLEDIDASGAGKIFVDGFQGEKLALELSGAVKMNAAVDVGVLNVEINGASELELIGQGDRLEADLSGASHLNAGDYKAKTGDINASGASSARVNVRGDLERNVSGGSRVENRGKEDPQD